MVTLRSNNDSFQITIRIREWIWPKYSERPNVRFFSSVRQASAKLPFFTEQEPNLQFLNFWIYEFYVILYCPYCRWKNYQWKKRVYASCIITEKADKLEKNPRILFFSLPKIADYNQTHILID